MPDNLQWWKLDKTPTSIWKEFRRSPTAKMRDRIATQNSGLVRKVAHKYEKKCREPYEDLVQVGSIGLVQAIDSFDVNLGYAFTSHAIPKIRSEILHYLRDARGITKVPRAWQETYDSVLRQKKAFAAVGREASLKECAIALNVNGSQWELIEEAVKYLPHTDINELLREPVSTEDSPDSIRQELGKRAYHALAGLPAQHRKAVIRNVLKGVSAEVLAGDLQMLVPETRALIAEGLNRIKSSLEDTLYANH